MLVLPHMPNGLEVIITTNTSTAGTTAFSSMLLT